MAALTCEKKTLCTQPVSMPTRRREGPRGAMRAGMDQRKGGGDGGKEGLHGLEAAGQQTEQAEARTRRWRPERW